jgi:transcriptional regulator with XRE-family HTH domain
MPKPVKAILHLVDVAVGASIRLRRRAIKVTQDALAEAIDFTFQRVQKYERGANRICASCLYEICQVLKCHPADLVPAPDWYRDDTTPKWVTDARVSHILHPRLFEILLAISEDNLHLLVIGLLALMAEAPLLKCTTLSLLPDGTPAV